PGHRALHRPALRLGALSPSARSRGDRRRRDRDLQDDPPHHGRDLRGHRGGRRRALARGGAARGPAGGHPPPPPPRPPPTLPRHITAGYQKLRGAGLLCLTLDAEYGGYGLPVLVNCAYLEMVSRADPSLMTIIGLQAGVAQDIEKYGSEELRREYLPRFVSG